MIGDMQSMNAKTCTSEVRPAAPSEVDVTSALVSGLTKYSNGSNVEGVFEL